MQREAQPKSMKQLRFFLHQLNDNSAPQTSGHCADCAICMSVNASVHRGNALKASRKPQLGLSSTTWTFSMESAGCTVQNKKHFDVAILGLCFSNNSPIDGFWIPSHTLSTPSTANHGTICSAVALWWALHRSKGNLGNQCDSISGVRVHFNHS